MHCCGNTPWVVCGQDAFGLNAAALSGTFSLISNHLVDCCEDPLNAGDGKELLEMGDDALQQPIAVASGKALCGRQGVCQRCAPVLSLHKAPHRCQHAL